METGKIAEGGMAMDVRQEGKSGVFYLGAFALLAFAIFALGGCAKSKVKPGVSKEGPLPSPAVKMDEGEGLADIAQAVKTPEDALILDLLISYRMLLLKHPDTKALDKETLKKGRQAFEKLESALRHGGVKSKEGGERVFKVVDEEKLSLEEVIRTASQSAGKSVQDGEWEKARARWKEIIQSKAAVAIMMEEAQWGLVLSDALQSAMPDSTKKRLKQVNESYLAEINHEEIAKQVKKLLEEVPEVKLQRELKKLANRSWEKGKRAGHITPAQTVQTEPPEARVPAGESVSNQNDAPPSPETAKVNAQVDTLASQGKYLAALKAMDSEKGPTWTKKKNEIGDLFCEEKRKSAANAFKDFKNANADSVKITLLKLTAGYLDSCLFYFPDLPVSQKVRKNRVLVETELKKLVK